MNKLIVAIIAVAFAATTPACKGDDKKTEPAKGAEPAGGGGKADPGTPSVAVTAEMQDFMRMLEGKHTHVEAALSKHGAEALDSQDMDMYDLQQPKVVSAEGACYTMDAKAGMTTRTYILCWQDGKIASVEDKGMR